jgi:PAP2 superfamily
MKLIIVLFVLVFYSTAHAEEKLKFIQTFTEIPSTSIKSMKKAFSKDALPYWGIIAGTTAITYYYDEQLLADFQKRGREWRIGNEDNTRSAVSFGGHEIVRLPSDTGSALYFLGDGWMHTSIAVGFMGVGSYIDDDNRAFNTGIMIFHGMFVSTIFNQALKRSFGRESPEVKHHERGNWRPFPSFNEYNSKTASYDAMPTGHLMTSAMTFTIISERYPEYKQYIYPFAGVWMTALGFQMVNNGVHWVSDYPLGIGMGYLFGKMATQMGKKDIQEPGKESTSWLVLPTNNGLVAMKAF